MKKICTLLTALCFGFFHKSYGKQVEIVNISSYDLVLKVITVHDYFQFVGTTSTGPGPVTHGCNFGPLTNYSTTSNIVIVPAGQTVDLYDYINGSYNASVNNSGSFPFGWGSTLNPFFGKVFNYSTIGGVDVPTSSTPISLPMGYTADSCVKSMTIGWVYPGVNNNFEVIAEATHTSADGAGPKVEITPDGAVVISRYEHRPLTNWTDFSQCVKDRITFNYVE